MSDSSSTTTLLAECFNCGHVNVAPTDVTIRNCVDTDDWSYWFICPTCRSRSTAATGRRAALDALRAGSRLQTWTLPSEVNERPDGPPLTFVDLLEMRLLLIEADWTDRLA